MMWDNIVLSVGKASAFATSVINEIALANTSKELKELQGRVRKMGTYLTTKSFFFC
jgi:hypothetical protein